jgi:hypothetical protein
VAVRHTEMASELTMLQAVVSYAVESTLGCSPNEIFCVEVVGMLVVVFQRQQKRHSRLERPVIRICDPLLRPPLSRVRLADCLDEAAR